MTILANNSKGITAGIIRSHLLSAAEEMSRTLVNTSFNTVIYDVHDFGISIYDENLDLIAEAPGIPSFLGANDYAIRKAVNYIHPESFSAGDILVMNYPYWNSAHTYDATLFAPVFHSGADLPVAYEVIRAHWMDLGAKNPGSVLDSTDVHQEGVIFPGTKVYSKGEPNIDILELMKFNSRMPESIMGDLNAQVSSIRTGQRRLSQILEKFGLPAVRQAVDVILKSGEDESHEALAALPPGSWSAEDYLDDDGISDEKVFMKATVTISEREFKVDFTGSSPIVKGPINLPLGSTYSHCQVVFKSLTTPKSPSNAGHYRPLKVEAPDGSVFNATYPAPTFLLRAGHASVDLIYKALAKGLGDIVSASTGGDLPGFSMIGTKKNIGRVYWISNNEPIGWGGSKEHDGSNALHHPTASIGRNTPIEVMELKSGMHIERLELLRDSGGPGKHRGGLGVRRDILFVDTGVFTSMIKKSKTRTWGLRGGSDSDPTCMYVRFGTDKEQKVGMFRYSVVPGDRCSLRTAGGGGYGNSIERDPELVLQDVLDGYVSVEEALSAYKVAIEGEHIDWQRTNELRSSY